MTSADRQSFSTGNASDFYMACRDGDLMRVTRLLKTMTHREIIKSRKQMEVRLFMQLLYFGHPRIVQVLLDAGASTHTRNGHGLTPENEAKTQGLEIYLKNKIKIKIINYMCINLLFLIFNLL